MQVFQKKDHLNCKNMCIANLNFLYDIKGEYAWYIMILGTTIEIYNFDQIVN